jgi:hypothetical protein
MKRFAFLVSLLGVGLMVPGCPIYGDDEACGSDIDCSEGYLCDELTGLCSPEASLSCSLPNQCDPGFTCAKDGLCRAGDCTWKDIGCIAGFVCSGDSGVFRCEAGSSGGGGAGGLGTEPDPGGAGGSSDSNPTGGIGGSSTAASGGVSTSGGATPAAGGAI